MWVTQKKYSKKIGSTPEFEITKAGENKNETGMRKLSWIKKRTCAYNTENC